MRNRSKMIRFIAEKGQKLVSFARQFSFPSIFCCHISACNRHLKCSETLFPWSEEYVYRPICGDSASRTTDVHERSPASKKKMYKLLNENTRYAHR